MYAFHATYQYYLDAKLGISSFDTPLPLCAWVLNGCSLIKVIKFITEVNIDH